jgi:TPR repeat protein
MERQKSKKNRTTTRKNNTKKTKTKTKTKTKLEKYKEDAKNGDADAQYNLGQMFRNGEGVKQNIKEVLRLFRLSAKQGHTRAQNSLGFMIDEGIGIRKNKNVRHFKSNWCRKLGYSEDIFVQCYTNCWCWYLVRHNPRFVDMLASSKNWFYTFK